MLIVISGEECEGNTVSSSSSGSSHTMDVIFDMGWEVIVYNISDISNVLNQVNID